MARKKDEESGTYYESAPESELLFEHDDLVIKRVNGDSVEIAITKEMGGISDSTYSTAATGSQKNWTLSDQFGNNIDVGEQHGNRPFRWIGPLQPGLYTLVTGVSFNYSKRRIAGRGYRIKFKI